MDAQEWIKHWIEEDTANHILDSEKKKVGKCTKHSK
jgi:hypothetical protein